MQAIIKALHSRLHTRVLHGNSENDNMCADVIIFVSISDNLPPIDSGVVSHHFNILIATSGLFITMLQCSHSMESVRSTRVVHNTYKSSPIFIKFDFFFI
jgi:hypothetical protein